MKGCWERLRRFTRYVAPDCDTEEKMRQCVLRPIISDFDGAESSFLHKIMNFQQATAEDVQCAIRLGADVNAEDDHCKPPLYMAVIHQRLDLVRVLYENGAHITVKTYESALSDQRREEIVEYFLVECNGPFMKCEQHSVIARVNKRIARCQCACFFALHYLTRIMPKDVARMLVRYYVWPSRRRPVWDL